MSAVDSIERYERYHPSPAEHPSFLEAWHMNCRVANVHDDWSVAKPREECIPFTATVLSDEIGCNGGASYKKHTESARERVSKSIDRELNRKRKPKRPDNVAAFLRLRFPCTELKYLA